MKLWLTLFGAVLLAAPQQGGKKIGVSLLTRQHDFYKELEEGLVQEAAKHGFKLVVNAAEFDASRQAAQIEDFITQKVDAIIACPCDSQAIGATLDAAEKAGIPVFTADIAARQGKVVCHVASDNVLGGRLAAREMARHVKDGSKVLVIDHPLVASVQDRVKGFEEELKKLLPGATIVKQAAEGQREKAMKVMEDMLQSHRDLAGVFGINDDSALGALAAVAAAGRSEIVIVGYDATPEAREAIGGHTPLRADVIQNPATIGRTAIDAIHRHFRGEKLPSSIPVEVGLYDRAAAEKEKQKKK
jgi:ribose transport system substrate-binding protein